jgi:hypothetical protein
VSTTNDFHPPDLATSTESCHQHGMFGLPQSRSRFIEASGSLRP